MHPLAPQNLRRPTRTRHCHVMRALAASALGAALVASASADTVTPPMRADMSLNGNVVDSRDSGNLATCHSLCKSGPGCTGFTFNRPAAAAKSTCRRLSGPLTDVVQVGTVSCRMPCEPGPRASVLLPKSQQTILRPPEATTLSVPARLTPPPPPPPPAPASGAKK